jgi:hypothetical protein
LKTKRKKSEKFKNNHEKSSEILSNNEIVKATAVEDEIKDLKIGDKILLSSKAFNPIVNKI